MSDQRSFLAESKRRLDKLTSVRVTRTVAKPADIAAPRPHPDIANPHQWQDHGVEPDDVQDMGTPLAEQHFNTLSFSPMGVPEELALDEQPDSAFDFVRPDMHALYLESLAANRGMRMERKHKMESSLRAAIAALGSQCPCCGSNEVCAQGQVVTVVWVGLAYRFELPVPMWYCGLCQQTFTVRPLQISCMPATPVHSWDLRKAAYGSRPIWFDMDLIQASYIQTCLSRASRICRRICIL